VLHHLPDYGRCRLFRKGRWADRAWARRWQYTRLRQLDPRVVLLLPSNSGDFSFVDSRNLGSADRGDDEGGVPARAATLDSSLHSSVEDMCNSLEHRSIYKSHAPTEDITVCSDSLALTGHFGSSRSTVILPLLCTPLAF
jgi:hypothetical protein